MPKDGNENLRIKSDHLAAFFADKLSCPAAQGYGTGESGPLPAHADRECDRVRVERIDPKVRRGVFHSVRDLQRAITEFLAAWNANPTPFVWTASVERILDKIARCRQRLEQVDPGCTLPKRRTKTMRQRIPHA